MVFANRIPELQKAGRALVGGFPTVLTSGPSANRPPEVLGDRSARNHARRLRFKSRRRLRPTVFQSEKTAACRKARPRSRADISVPRGARCAVNLASAAFMAPTKPRNATTTPRVSVRINSATESGQRKAGIACSPDTSTLNGQNPDIDAIGSHDKLLKLIGL